MYTPIDQMPDHSRIWIYQSNRKFSDEEVQEIEKTLQAFVEEWVAHATPLTASFEVKYNRFIILAVDQDMHAASGCSIDASVRVIQEFEAKYNVDLLDKMNVTYKTGDFIAFKTLIEFKQLVKSKAVSANTIVFNNLVNDLGEYREFWEVPASESWHSRFFK
ncbi:MULTISPECIES: ABC transporter ATPase [Myroides]|uniref:ABC transporter ATPase n=1 Tax=Myroides albus TaxID=2562892 RepID=A0A6I3LDU1_9FLAO|nr:MULTISPECIES: ABC transporter ATPase [Myroides]MTG97629.1 ABC transporter ATPase [Myroides albus]MVX36751.1 ABC transporter ATPase [Myroides sp. LoEW2-1]UVD79253.1 ABC transporter ATPase [Myroides albus]